MRGKRPPMNCASGAALSRHGFACAGVHHPLRKMMQECGAAGSNHRIYAGMSRYRTTLHRAGIPADRNFVSMMSLGRRLGFRQANHSYFVM